MSASPNPSHPLASAIRHGKTLTTLLYKVKCGAESTDEYSIDMQVEEVVTDILRVFNWKQRSASLIPEESLARLLKKIEETLDEFIKFDPAIKAKYDSLAMKVNKCKPRRVQSSEPSSTSLGDDSYPHQSSTFNHSQTQDMVEAAYQALGEELAKHLLAIFALYPADMFIKKRDLLHCWIALGINREESTGDCILYRLVSDGLIEQIIKNKRSSGKYRMHPSVRSNLKPSLYAANDHSDDIWSTLLTTSREAEALLNLNETVLNAEIYESIFKLSNLKVLHLGTWRDDPGHYIVAEGIKAFKELRSLKFLSLQGISGIEMLPDSVYRMYNLEVLDLRACHNLESVSAEGIISLKNLTHLDVSQCYLLGHLPKAITQLDQLKVLKGFVINSPPQFGKKRNRMPENARPCAFSDLSKLKRLVKLTVRTRRLTFPTEDDLKTLCELIYLQSLRIAWVGSSNDRQICREIGNLFPNHLHKLELQAASEEMATYLLTLISADKDNRLYKLYIRGGGLSDLQTTKHQLLKVEVLRLRYLPQLRLHWRKFRKSFSGLKSLEILGCPNLVGFPCDRNGVWEPTEC